MNQPNTPPTTPQERIGFIGIGLMARLFTSSYET